MLELVFFFFKQKTAYDMRISDWSSDVCSSDLAATCPRGGSQAPRLPCIRRTETMLDDDLKPQLAAYLERLVGPIVLVASVDDGDKSRELLALLEDTRALSHTVSVAVRRQDDQHKPHFALTPPAPPIHPPQHGKA